MQRSLSLLLIVLVGLAGACGEDEKPKFPELPEDFATASGREGISLTWSTVADANSYGVYRSEGVDGEYVPIWVGPENTYIDKDVISRKTYFYKVTSINTDGRENDLVQPLPGEYIPPPPELHVVVKDLRTDRELPDVFLELKGDGYNETCNTDSHGTCVFKLREDRMGAVSISAVRDAYMPKVCQVDVSKADWFEIDLKPIPKVTGTIKSNVYPFQTPAYVIFSNDGVKAYVTNMHGNSVNVIDVSTDTVRGQIPVGDEPIGLVRNPKATEPYIYVVNHQDGTVSVVDTTKDKVIDTVEVGRLPTHAVVSNDGGKLYVVNSGDNTVSVVDLTPLPHESDTIEVGRIPYGVAISHNDGFLYVTNEFDHTVSVVSTSDESEKCVVSVGKNPMDIVYVHSESQDMGYVMVSNYLGTGIAVFEACCGAVPEAHEVGRLPTGIAVAPEPDGSHTAYIALKAESAVRIFNLVIKSRESSCLPTPPVVEELIQDIGVSPVGIAAHPNGDKIYVVNSDGNSVTVLGY